MGAIVPLREGVTTGLRAAGLTFLALFAASGHSYARRTDPGPAQPEVRPVATAWRFATIGLYASLPTDLPPTDPNIYEFLEACGYNYLEFCEAGFRSRPDRLPEYYARMSHAIDLAHKRGFQVGILLLAGMKQWKGPGQTGWAGVFSPLDAPMLEERLTHLRREVRELRRADRFLFIPGDPGGDPTGRSKLDDCLRFARQVHRIVKEEAPKAVFAMNLWAIAGWEGSPSPMSLRFWQQEVRLSQAVAGAPDFLGPDCGVVFPLHNHYRSLSLACYSKAGVAPELYPTDGDIGMLRARGVKPLLGWPYFLVDEADDGFITPNNVESGGQSSCEARYLRSLVDRGLELRLDGLVANAIFLRDEALNVYAFGRMCRSPELSAEQAIDSYASVIADDSSRVPLGRVLRFVENHSNWQVSLPAASRLEDFDVPDVPSASAALDLLARVKPRGRPPIPLPEPPARYLERLEKRLQAIRAGRIGDVSPIR